MTNEAPRLPSTSEGMSVHFIGPIRYGAKRSASIFYRHIFTGFFRFFADKEFCCET
jgi:hypothetical protein